MKDKAMTNRERRTPPYTFLELLELSKMWEQEVASYLMQNDLFQKRKNVWTYKGNER